MKVFKRKITPKWIRKTYSTKISSTFETYIIGLIKDDPLHNSIFIQIRGDEICLLRGIVGPSYWICDIEYIYQLKQMLKIFKIM